MDRSEQINIRSAIKRENDENAVIDMLKKLDPNTKIIDGTLLNYSTLYDKYEVTKYLLQRGADVNAPYEGDFTPLMSAIENENSRMVELLLKHGADVNKVDRDGNSALWQATVKYKDDSSIIKQLIDHGANPHLKNKFDRTPDDVARQEDWKEVIKLFEKNNSFISLIPFSMNSPKPLVLQWNQLLLSAIACTKTSPPLTARALAMLHTAMYDAWSVYDKCAISTTTARLIKNLGNEHDKPQNEDRSMSYAAYRVCSHLFCGVLPAENRSMFRDFMCSLGYNPDDQSLDICTATGVGNLSGRMQVEYRLGDGSNPVGSLHMPPWSDYTGYVPVNTPDQVKELDHWQPLRVEVAKGEYKVQNFLVPHWSLVRSFALQKPNQFRPDEPYWKNQTEFQEQAAKVLQVSASLTDEHKVIAEYWADGAGTFTPPGHWAEIADYISDTRDFNTARCIKIFFALSNAMLDSSIACWDSKRRYDYVRPVTALRELYRGKDVKAWGGPHQGTQIIKGEAWCPYIATPPFPEHVSGHSVFSTAAASILQCFVGDSFNGCIVIKKGDSKIEPGTTPATDITLNWPGFSDAADQAGLSRLFGGIHFERAIILGRELGVCIGNNTWERAKYFFNDR